MQVLRQGITGRLKIKAFLMGVIFFGLFLIIGSWWSFQQSFQNRFYDGIMIDEIDVSGLTKAEALSRLKASTTVLPEQTVTLVAGEQSIASSTAQLGQHREYDEIVDTAFQLGRSQGFVDNTTAIADTYFNGKKYRSQIAFDPIKVQEFVTALAVQIHSNGQSPKASVKSGKVEIFPGKVGRGLIIEDTVKNILMSANSPQLTFAANLQPVGVELTPPQIADAQARAEKYLGKTVEAKVDVITVTVSDAQLVEALALPTGYDDTPLEKILQTFKDRVDRPAQDAKFSYDPTTLKVGEFVPDQDGLTIKETETKAELLKAMQSIEQGSQEKVLSMNISTTVKKANITLASLNNLGLKERVGFGESYYDHSIPSRIHNVSQASKIVNNTIVKPGEEFSFNKALGEVSKATGFQPAYVIKSGQTVLGDGGGVCQVSTTLFRALLDGGMNITKRKAHSYRVSYYELNRDPGFDATVYAGDVDLRFMNDTPGHLLLHFETFPDKKYMFVTIYGTDDGRQSIISDYKKWDARGPAPTQYIDDPTLPPGKLVQIDYAVGGIKAQFKYTVKDKDGNLKYENVYYSNYVPWSAKYRRGV